MTKKQVAVLLGALLGLPALNAFAQELSPAELQQRMIERRAVDAVIWGMPIISLDAMRQAYFRDGKAKYDDIIWWPKGRYGVAQGANAIAAGARGGRVHSGCGPALVAARARPPIR
jgi:hypothetical protein